MLTFSLPSSWDYRSALLNMASITLVQAINEVFGGLAFLLPSGAR